MVVLALLILLVVVAAAAAAIVRGSEPATLDLQVFDINTNVTGVFIIGAASVLLGVFGTWLLLAGLKRNHRRRAEMHQLRDRAKKNKDSGDRPGSKSGEPGPRDADGHLDSAPRDT